MEVKEEQVREVEPDLGVAAAGILADLAGGGGQVIEQVGQAIEVMGDGVGMPTGCSQPRPVRGQAAAQGGLGIRPLAFRRPGQRPNGG